MSETWLLLETSSRVGRVGLGRAGQVLQEVALDPSRKHARDLAATVGQVLDREGLSPRAVTGVMVSIGPGSYTGLRVGITSAKAFAFATDAALVAVPTFHALAEQAPEEASQQWIVADALQGQAYLQAFRRNDEGEWQPSSDLAIAPMTEQKWPEDCQPWVNGPGIAVFEALLPPHWPRVDEIDRNPRLLALYRAGLRLAPLPRDSMLTLEPLYLRGSSAEEKAKRQTHTADPSHPD